MNRQEEDERKYNFIRMVSCVREALEFYPGPYFLEDFSVADVIFAPYLERINASLYYYKGYSLREDQPKIGEWFDAMEKRECYRGTMGDFNTHNNVIPRLLGGCHFKDRTY